MSGRPCRRARRIAAALIAELRRREGRTAARRVVRDALRAAGDTGRAGPRTRLRASVMTEDIGAPFDLERPLAPLPPTVRICQRITPEAAPRADAPPVEQAYAVLTQPLPLAGAAALRPTSGGFTLTDRLTREMPWMQPATDRIAAQLALQAWVGRPWLAFGPLLIVGPPGCGKTAFAKRLAELAGVQTATISFSGVSDNRLLEGTARGWTGQLPCWPALVIAATGTANPILIADEVDKAGGSDRNGRPLDTLLMMLEPASARAYPDPCLVADLDLSHCNWVLLANRVAPLPAALRSRLDIVEVAAPGPGHFDAAMDAIAAALARRLDVGADALPPLRPATRARLRTAFARARSLRALARLYEAAVIDSIREQPRRPG